MGIQILQKIDDICTRREIRRCMDELPPVERVAFLYWCCDTVGPIEKTLAGDDVLLTITNETGEPNESYLDLMQIVAQFGLDPKICLAELERRARQISRPAGIEDTGPLIFVRPVSPVDAHRIAGHRFSPIGLS